MKALLDSLKPGETDWELAQSLHPDRLPSHIAIIMDGNGRWANRRSLPRVAGHRAGIESVRVTVETCVRLKVPILTLYAFSVENWKRPRTEVDTLWKLLHLYVRREISSLMENGVRMKAIGRLDALPAQVREDLHSTEEMTAHNRGLLVNLAINYSGRAEIVDAVNTLVNTLLEKARSGSRASDFRIDEAAIASHLYTTGLPDPDLLIRTSGELRISNFLLWQIAYSELYVTSTLWPDFRRTDLLRAILDYQKRERRFGGLSRSIPQPTSERFVEAVSIPAK